MAKYDELPVFKATYDLLLRIYMVSQHWSRDIRYTLGEELKKEVIEILQLIYQANASKKKVAFLSSCRVKLIKVRLQIRVAKDLKTAPPQSIWTSCRNAGEHIQAALRLGKVRT